jgi:anti-sigma B factor antagonist
MALNIKVRDEDGVCVVDLEGRIVIGPETSSLRDTVKGLLSQGKKIIILNLLNVSFMDSTGLGTLVAAHSSAKSAGASLRLCDLGPRFSELLQITKLYTVFEIYDSEYEAFRALSNKASAD